MLDEWKLPLRGQYLVRSLSTIKSIHFKVRDLSLALLKVKSTTFSAEGSSPTLETNHDSLAMAKSLLV